MLATAPSTLPIARYENRIVVGVGGFAVSNDKSAVLSTYSLGSCLGITVYDPVVRAAGLLHVMLPDSPINPAKARLQPGMFVDTGLPALFRALYQIRAEKQRVRICVAGGAKFMDNSGFFNIGERNFQSLQALLKQHQLSIQSQQLGGLVSRTLFMHVETGEVFIKSSGQTEQPRPFGG